MGNPIRILHVVVNMNRGGAETLIMNLYRNVDHSRIQFDFLTCKEGVFDSEIIDMGGRVHRIPYITDVGHFGYVRALNQFFTSYPEYRVVHSHMNKMSGLVLRSAKKAGVPVRIVHSHNTSSEGGIAAKTYKSFAGKWIRPCSTHLLACSNEAARWLFGDKADQAAIVKNGIECDRFSFSQAIREKVREELSLDPGQLVIGHVGRFTQQKNHSFLLDIFAELSKIQPKAVLVLAGEGPLREKIEQKAKELDLVENVKFLGIRNDINRLLQALDVLVFPSFHEGLPVTLIEAQRSGLPCLISDVITKEVDMGVNRVKYAPLRDKKKWVEGILNLSDGISHARMISSDSFIKKGYDIKNTAGWTQGFYLAVSR